MTNNLVKLLQSIIELFTYNSIILDKNKKMSYTEMFTTVKKLTRFLNHSYTNVEHGVKILLVAENSVDWIICFLGILFSKHQLILFNPKGGNKILLEQVINRERVDILIYDNINFSQLNCPLLDKRVLVENLIKRIEISIRLEENSKNNLNLITNEKTSSHLTIYTPRSLTEIKLDWNEDIYKRLMSLERDNIFKINSNYIAYMDFTYNYIIGLLLPLVRGCNIIIPESNSDYAMQIEFARFKPTTIILTAYRLELLYKGYIEVSTDIINNTLKYLHLWWIRKLILNYNLKKILPNTEKIILLNSKISYNITNTLKKLSFPLVTNYYTIDCCGVYNNTDLDIQRGIWFTNGELVENIEYILKDLVCISDCIPILIKSKIYLLTTVDYSLAEEMNLSEDQIREFIQQRVNKIIRKEVISIILIPGDFQRDLYDRIVFPNLENEVTSS